MIFNKLIQIFRKGYARKPNKCFVWELIDATISYCCFGCWGGGGGVGLKHCSRNAVYRINAIDIAIRAYMKIFSSGDLNRFLRSHSSTSSSIIRSPNSDQNRFFSPAFILNFINIPLKILGKRFRKYTIDGNFVTPHFRAYRASAIFTNVMSKLSVSLSMFSSFSKTAILSGWPASSE